MSGRMSDYKIEKGIPDPLDSKRGPKYPFREMAIGDSFYLNKDDRNKVACMASHMRRYGLFFSTLPDVEGYRCWSIKPPAASRGSGARRNQEDVQEFDVRSKFGHETDQFDSRLGIAVGTAAAAPGP